MSTQEVRGGQREHLTENQVVAGSIPALGTKSPRKIRDFRSMGKLIDRYIESRLAQGNKVSSYHPFKTVWEPLRELQINDVFTEMVEDLLDQEAKERGLSPASRNLSLSVLSGFFRWAVARNYVQENPVSTGRVPRYKVRNARTRWLRTHEVKKLVKVSPWWLRPIILFAVKTGMRLNEICTLSKDSVQRDDNGQYFLQTGITKNGSRLHWPLEGMVLQLVLHQRDEAKGPEYRLFPGPDGGDAKTSIRRHLPKAVKKAGMKWGRQYEDGVTFHTLRHTMASLAINSGIPFQVVQRMGNWSQPTMVLRYAHLADTELRKAARVLDELV